MESPRYNSVVDTNVKSVKLKEIKCGEERKKEYSSSGGMGGLGAL